jgi:hypothetical protein
MAKTHIGVRVGKIESDAIHMEAKSKPTTGLLGSIFISFYLQHAAGNARPRPQGEFVQPTLKGHSWLGYQWGAPKCH